MKTFVLHHYHAHEFDWVFYAGDLSGAIKALEQKAGLKNDDFYYQIFQEDTPSYSSDFLDLETLTNTLILHTKDCGA